MSKQQLNFAKYGFRVWSKAAQKHVYGTRFLLGEYGHLYQLDSVDDNLQLLNPDDYIVERCIGSSAASSYLGSDPQDLLIYEGDIVVGTGCVGERVEEIVEYISGEYFPFDYLKPEDVEIIGTRRERECESAAPNQSHTEETPAARRLRYSRNLCDRLLALGSEGDASFRTLCEACDTICENVADVNRLEADVVRLKKENNTLLRLLMKRKEE